MNNSNKWKFVIVLLIIGFMVAVQYNSMKNPEVRDTRDLWAIRNELAAEQKLHSELLSEIRELDQTITAYKQQGNNDTGKVLKDTVDKLYRQAGMTNMQGAGIELEVRPSAESVALGIPITGISPDLLTRFVNELNRFNWKGLEIDGKRFTPLSSIRDINGATTVDGLNVSTPPFTIRILSPAFADSEKLYNYLLGSSIHDDFYIDNLILEIGKPVRDMEIRGWSQRLNNQFLHESPKGG